MRLFLYLLFIALSVVVHILVGWGWTFIVAVAAGYILGRSGWMTGALVLAAGWMLLVGYNFRVAPYETGQMLATMGALMGNLPAWLVVCVTLLIGTALGALGGAAGAHIATAIRVARAR